MRTAAVDSACFQFMAEGGPFNPGLACNLLQVGRLRSGLGWLHDPLCYPHIAGCCLWPGGVHLTGPPPLTTTGLTASRLPPARCCWQPTAALATAPASIMVPAPARRPAQPHLRLLPDWRPRRMICCCTLFAWRRRPCQPGCEHALACSQPSCIEDRRMSWFLLM